MKLCKPFDTLIFDLGNVLIRVDPSQFIRKITEVTDLDNDCIIHYFMTSECLRSYEKGEISNQQFYETVCHDLSLALSKHRFKTLWQSMFFPIEPMITWLSTIRNQFQLVILSNTNAWHMNYCEHNYPFMHWFDHRLYSHQLGLAKPDPEIFEKALNTSRTSPEHTLFIDDMEENTIAASAMGIRTVHFTGASSFFKTWSRISKPSGRRVP